MVFQNKKILFAFLITLSLCSIAYAAQTVNDRRDFNEDNLTAIDDGDAFGYQIEAIGDLDGNGVTDLAVAQFAEDSGETNVGSVLILFMNSDGTISSTNEIIIDDGAGGITASCNVDADRDPAGLEQMAFIGNLINGNPTLAISAIFNDHAGAASNTGAVFLLELSNTGTVSSCERIIEDENGFDPDTNNYRTDAFLGFPLIATDVDGDGNNELIVGANNENDDSTNLWVMFLRDSGSGGNVVTKAQLILSTAITGLGSNVMSEGAPIDGGKKIVIGEEGDDEIFIVTINSTETVVTSTQITAASLGLGASLFGSGIASIGDLDGNGVDDIVVGDASQGTGGTVYVLYLNSDGTVKETQEISGTTETARTGSSHLLATDAFGHGMALWTDVGSNAVIAIGAHQDDTADTTNSGAMYLFYITRASSTVTAETGGGGSDGQHKTKPTFGIDHKTNFQIVDDGLTINGESFTVDDNYWTQIPMQYLQVGEVQNFTAKVYAPKELHVMEFLFGIPEVGKWDKAEASIAFFFDYQGDLEQVDWNNKENIINMTSIHFTTDKVPCKSDDDTNDCRQVSIELEFKEAPSGKVLGLQAIDHKRRSNILYFNDGITLQGDSQNPPLTQEILSNIKYKGLQTIQRIDKEQDIWITLDDDEPVSKYQQNSFGTFFPIEWKKDIIPKDKLVTLIAREHSKFYKIIDYETKRAVKQFDSSTIQSTLDDSISSDALVSENYFMTMPKEHSEFYKILDYEIRRAMEKFDSSTIQVGDTPKVLR